MSALTQRGTVQLSRLEKAAARMIAAVRNETESSVLRQFTAAGLMTELHRLQETLGIPQVDILNLFAPEGEVPDG